ncbi:MAG: glycosyltransferase [Pseudomonadota bacterium]
MSAPIGATLAIIVPHYDDVARLRRCLDALVPQLTPDTDLVIADNASTEDLAPVRAAHPDLRIVPQPDRGAAAARNAGVAATDAPGLAFLDADCVPAPDWVARARAIAAAGDAVTGGRIDVFDETPAPRSGAEAFETVFAFDQAGYIADKGFSVTANLVTTRAVFAATGPFVPGLSEDLDWCHRATARGYSIRYDPDLAVAHPTRADWPALARKWQRLTEESWGLKARDGRHSPAARMAWVARAALALPGSIPAHAPRILRHPDLTGTEKRAALGTLARIRLTRAGWMLGQATRAR